MSVLEPPYTLVLELTYRCPLRCGYCSNPLDWASRRASLTTSEWLDVLGQSAELGALSAHFTGGEPLLRSDLEALVRGARSRDLYSTLVTSGVTLTPERLRALRAAGIDAIQLSIQDASAAGADRIAGARAHAHKLEVAGWVRELGLPLTINVVLHRQNIELVEDLIALAFELGADRLELANVQLLGWALVHRDALLPTAAQIEKARAAARDARARLAGRMEIVFVLPDYFTGRPRACMSGWAQRYLVVTPDGLALPCHAARDFPGLPPPSVRERRLAEIWATSALFTAFRGEGWMTDPCRSCDRRSIDFGGCRCQALALTGDPRAADPTCVLAPAHAHIVEARALAERTPLVPVHRLARS